MRSTTLKITNEVNDFLSGYNEQVINNAYALRKVIVSNLPGVIEQLDIPAKMIAYTFGQKYSELICVIIPSQKGLKLGFNKGNELPDLEKLLQGSGKTSRYVIIESETQIFSGALKKLLAEAHTAYKLRTNKK